MTQVLAGKELQLDTFSRVERSLPGSGLPWLAKLRRAGIERFGALGFPGERDEAWRFTKTDAIAETSFVLADRLADLKLDTLAGLALCPFGFYRLVFFNGRFSPELSITQGLPEGVRLANMASVLQREPARLEAWLSLEAGPGGAAFPALNAALFSDGAFLYLPKGCVLDKPVHLIFVSSAPTVATMTHARVLVAAEEGAQASVIEEFVGLDRGPCLTNMASQVRLAAGAGLSHYRIQRESDRALHVSTATVRQAADSRYESHVVSLGGALVRNDVHALLDGTGADCALNGLYLVRGRQLVDNHTLIEHAKPHGTSRELYKGVLDGQSRAVFDGAVVVQKDAQKTDARVYNKNLLLSEDGLVNTKPEFKIHANDVQCKHGATIGQMSADALFYLRSRGMAEADARRLLVNAFAGEMVERMGVLTLREALAESLRRRLPEEAA